MSPVASAQTSEAKPHPHDGWIGGACAEAAACGGGELRCLEDMPGGFCSKDCTKSCPDKKGRARTFCADLGGEKGICVLRCKSDEACRPGYECADVSRPNSPDALKTACIPAPDFDALPAQAPAVAEKKPEEPPSEQPTELATKEIEPEGPDHTLAYIVLGGGAASTIAGVAFYFVAQSTFDEAQGYPPGPKFDDATDSFTTQRAVSWALLGVGLAGVGVGTWLLLREDSGDAQAPQAALQVGPGGLALGGVF